MLSKSEVRNLHDSLVLSLDAFVRSIGVQKGIPHALFLGAGASISSGIPSAETCIWEWKRDLFVTNNPGLEKQFSEISLPSVKQRIQEWLDSQGMYPDEGASEEYGFYIGQCFPIAEDRRTYFQEKIRTARPHIGYRLLCHLAQADLFRSVWSTNFDGLPARAAADFDLVPREVGIDSQNRLIHSNSKGELLCVSLHGDYRYDELKNTTEEVQRQEEALVGNLINQIQHSPLIVCGYSGRDQSIVEAMYEAYSRQPAGTLYWCGYGDGQIPKLVADLLFFARSQGNEAFYVPSLGFDDLMTRLALHCLQGGWRENARSEISAIAPRNLLDREPFQVEDCRTKTLIKSNAFEVFCPGEVLSFGLKNWPSEKVWSWIREQVGHRPLVAVPLRGKILALGTIEDIRDAFKENVDGPIQRVPISPAEMRFEDGVVVRLMREALVRSIAKSAGLATDGHSKLWEFRSQKAVSRAGLQCHIHDSVNVSMRRAADCQYVVIEPSVEVLDENGVRVPVEIGRQVKLSILGSQYNRPFNIAVNKWRGILFPNQDDRLMGFEFPVGSDSSFRFQVRRSPVFAQIGRPRGSTSPIVHENLRPLLKQEGLELSEPKLLFCNKQGTGTATDTHPIRGILQNRPFDHPLTLKGLAPSLRVGVVCPQKEMGAVHRYLQQVNQSSRPSNSERDYLLDYPGFQLAYGLPLELPEPNAPGWVVCPEPSGNSAKAAAVSVGNHITLAVEALRSSYAPHVVLVFFPQRWDHLRGYSDSDERFDVHDFVKAYAVQRGIATQFLNQDTMSDNQQCRVWWWLSLALFVKGMRTPWVLNELDSETAYVGLGFSIDRNAEKGKHIILGCSHIYSSHGEGLQYRLSKIEDPLIRRGNPFMSSDDARRTGETIRQLFFNARMKLPRRVVLHKRTPFLRDERDGLLDGLGDVDAIDMLEIQKDHALRYVASVTRSNGKVDEDNYPVRRGTVVKLEHFAALLWVHGATAAVDPRLRYYQGKRRIPAPLILRRHAGVTPLRQLCAEILGLSKMNWNSFDLYSQFPATLQSSSEIARIGSLLQRFGASSYDYRLFI